MNIPFLSDMQESGGYGYSVFEYDLMNCDLLILLLNKRTAKASFKTSKRMWISFSIGKIKASNKVSIWNTIFGIEMGTGSTSVVGVCFGLKVKWRRARINLSL